MLSVWAAGRGGCVAARSPCPGSRAPWPQLRMAAELSSCARPRSLPTAPTGVLVRAESDAVMGLQGRG